MIAVLSDIHSNLHALDAVLADIPAVSDIWVLGDTIGGMCPFPCQVLDRLMGLHIPVTAILGNWEETMLEVRHNIDPKLRAERSKITAGVWVIDTLQPHHWDYLSKLETKIKIGDALIYHGTPEDTHELITCQAYAKEVASRHDSKLLLGGHTHKPQLYNLGSQMVVNTGSVGQFDGMPGMACYVLLDGEDVSFRHVPYDFGVAVAAARNSELYGLASEYVEASIAYMRNPVEWDKCMCCI